MTIERHSDRKGSDYRNLGTAKAEDCAWLCSQDQRCRAFSYQTGPKRCWLKDRVPARYDYGPSVSGVKRGGHHSDRDDDYRHQERVRRNVDEMSNSYGAD